MYPSDGSYDKARKPYIPIDTCSPAGTWIEEKRYNKGRPTQSDGTSATSRKVLCGNWQEEAALEGDLLQMESTNANRGSDMEATNFTSSYGRINADMAATLGASLDVIRDGGNGRYVGGFKSSPYLTADVANPGQRELATTHRIDYNAKSSDVKALYQPALGVRSQLMLQRALASAEEEQARHKAETAERQAKHAQLSILRSSQRSGTGGVTAAATAAAAATLADPSTVYTDSVYKATLSNMHANESTSLDKDVIDELRQEYLSDEAITLYTGNPENGKTMTVHGKTPVDPVSSSRFSRHTYFTEPKYQL